MKAVKLIKFGGSDNLQIVETEKPRIKPNEVLVNVKAISINPVDVKLKYSDDMLTTFFGKERPLLLGWDIAGVITEIGSEVSEFTVGESVFGMVNFPGAGNAYAEFVASPANQMAKIPNGISFETAAATTLAALTALQILEGKVKEGDKVLVQAASGGVGHFAVQIAKSMGAEVIGTSSGKNRDFVLTLGADRHIDYKEEAFEDVLSDIDFVLDTQGGKVLENSIKVTKNGGIVFTTAAMELSEEVKTAAKKKNITASGMLVKSSGDDMVKLAEMLKSGRLKPNIQALFPFEKMGEAHDQLEKGRTVGKIVIINH